MIVEYPHWLPGIHATKRQKGEEIATVFFSLILCTVSVMFAELGARSDRLVSRCVFCTTVGKNLPVPLGEEGSQFQPDWNQRS